MASEFDNIKRSLSMLAKALDRLARLNYFNRKQYPAIILEIEDIIDKIRTWINNHEIFACSEAFYKTVSLFIADLGLLINQLWEKYKPKPGKRRFGKERRIREQNNLFKSVNSMIEHIAASLADSENNNSIIGIAIEEGMERSFDKTIILNFKKTIKNLISQRGEKTYIFSWNDVKNYHSLIKDKKRFCTDVVDKLGEHVHATGHKSSCKGPKKYVLCGFRKNSRKTIMPGGKQETFQIRMIQCKKCKQRFSLVPSFLPREKNFGIEIIGNVCRSMFLFGQSLQGAIEQIKIIGKRSVKSKQTILNWIRWMGTLHPAAILTRAGIKGSGYLQEDEGFEKEPNLRTYCVVMADPKNLLVWHADYVDHVDEVTLSGSFEKFLQKISFKILGVTKDKWQASTNALKTVFHRIWIGYCHRHCLKKFRQALEKYQAESGCGNKEISGLYKKFRKVLKTSTSELNLKVKIKSLNDEAFGNPLLKKRVAELEENATHYTSHKNRKGITQTTSLVDNYLKQIKRKLRQVESFRDKEWASLFFKAQANTRNFVPFLPGAKNAHKSPFMLAGGLTYDLSWIQTMNINNAFLFTEGAF